MDFSETVKDIELEFLSIKKQINSKKERLEVLRDRLITLKSKYPIGKQLNLQGWMSEIMTGEIVKISLSKNLDILYSIKMIGKDKEFGTITTKLLPYSNSFNSWRVKE